MHTTNMKHHMPHQKELMEFPSVLKLLSTAGHTSWLTALNCTFGSLHGRLVSSLPLRMTDPAVNRVVSDIIRSPEDKRVYRGLEFTNGLKAMLISDPTTDKSSAALDVHIGKGLSSLLSCQVVMYLSSIQGPLSVVEWNRKVFCCPVGYGNNPHYSETCR